MQNVYTIKLSGLSIMIDTQHVVRQCKQLLSNIGKTLNTEHLTYYK